MMLLNERENIHYDKIIKKKIRAGELPSFGDWKEQLNKRTDSFKSSTLPTKEQRERMPTIMEVEEAEDSFPPSQRREPNFKVDD